MIYVISPKSAYAAMRTQHEARNMKQLLKVVDIKWLTAHNFKLPCQRGDVLYIRNPYLKGRPDYLPQIIKLAKNFKARGGRVVDANIGGGDLGKGKWVDYQKLKKAKLPIPKTRLLSGYPLQATSYPLVLKWIYGMKAKGTFHINSQTPNSKIQNIIGRHPLKEWMSQEYIEADWEYKVITIGYKALPVILRFKFNKKLGRVDFNSVCSMPIYGPPGLPMNRHATNLVRLAEVASKTLGRELAKVDILEKEGRFYILEVNRFPGLKSFESLTGYPVFNNFVQYLAALQKSSNPL